ncbi:MAG: hypothetical protein OEV30_01590 [Ignavibacteria bacterium]|nr:hypothetical protein [Ignavibacteria bacterium]
MKHDELIREFEALAEQLGVTIRNEKGDFDGGYCILKDERILVVNKRLSPNRKAAVLAVGLNAIGLENVFLKPVIRAYVDDEVARVRVKAEQSTPKAAVDEQSPAHD